VVLLTGLLGGRLGYWLGHPHEIRSLGEFFALDRGGLSFFGGLSLAFPAYVLFLRWRRMPVWEISDTLSPVLPLSLGILRLGCFGAGCCYGTPTELSWAVHPMGSAIGLHPSQLYESAFLLILSGVLAWMNARSRLRAGLVACLCMGADGLYRFFFDALRGDMEHGWPGGISASQALGMLLVCLALGTAAWRFRAKDRG
jgi:phosphatidylglycerol:prolipoprotein diacylglycerol transferase